MEGYWGQIKLLLVEMEFLTKHIYEKEGGLPITVVYAGSAPGDEYLVYAKGECGALRVGKYQQVLKG